MNACAARPILFASEGVVVFVIGVDSHKSSLAVCVVDELGRSLGARTFANSAKGHAAASAWICEAADGERCFGIEATGGFAYAFSVLLDTQGERVFDVPPNQTDRERGRQTTRAKSDEKDALAIARITLRERSGWRRLRITRWRGICGCSAPTAASCARHARARPTGCMPTWCSSSRATSARAGARHPQAARRLRPSAGEARGRPGRARRLRLADLRRIDREMRVLEKRLRLLVPTTGTTLTEIHGVGPLVAAQIIGEVRSVERFATQNRFARHNGTAPIPASSGRSTSTASTAATTAASTTPST